MTLLFALEEMPDGSYAPVEAPPCGHLLDIPQADILLRCDRQAGHRETKHRAVLSLEPPHAVHWCNDRCSAPCDALKGYLRDLRWPSG